MAKGFDVKNNMAVKALAKRLKHGGWHEYKHGS